MTAPNLEPVFAGVLDEFALHVTDGTVHKDDYYYEVRDRLAAHVVAAIRDSGYTVIALPEPTSGDDTGTEWLDGEVFVGSPGNGRVRCYLEDHRLNDDDAADLGAALIAAAKHATGDTQ